MYCCYAKKLCPFLSCRLHDVVHSEKRIWLVFEYLDLDLKKFMDSCPEFAKSPALIKVSNVTSTCFYCFPYLFA